MQVRIPRIHGVRARSSLAIVVVLTFGVAISAGVAVARVAPSDEARSAAQLSDTLDGKATGGGTVLVPVNVVASFGFNGKRPPDFTQGQAQGRINYSRHAITPGGRHVNVPVVLMAIETTGSTGRAVLSGDCAGAQCSHGAASVLVYVEDNAEPGTTDKFRIFFCESSPFLPGPGFDGSTPPVQCPLGFEGGTLRSGNIQVRP
jgi:hypothetical protein